MQQSLVAQLFKSLGLTGTSMSTSSFLTPPNNPNSAERHRQDFLEAGNIQDPNIWTKYSNAMQRPSTYEQMLLLWDEMAGWDLIAAALLELVEEATATDETCPGTLWYECNDTGFEDELNTMLQRIDSESLLPSQVWHVSGFGNNFEKLDYQVGEGVMGMNFVHPMEMRRYWLEKNRRCVGFRWTGHPADKSKPFAYPDGTEIPRVGIGLGKNQSEELWYPFDFAHFRRMFRLRMTEHGEPIFDDAQGVYKKLRIAVDQMVVHRAQIQPDRYAVNIDVQEQAPRDQMLTVQRWKQSLRSKLSFGPGSTSSPNEFHSYYNATALDTILWVARPKGFNHSIEKLAGTATIPDVYDIELLQNLFFSVIGMPKWWVMGTKDGSNPPSGKALLASDIRFLRKVKSIRKPIKAGYQWLAYFHALLKGKDISTLDIKAKMSEIGSLEDQQKLEMLKLQSEALQGLGNLMTEFGLPREAWVEVIFKRYMHLPDDIVNCFITALPSDIPQQEGAPKQTISTTRLIAEIDKRMSSNPNLITIKKRMFDALDGKIEESNTTRYRTAADVLSTSMGSASTLAGQTGPSNLLAEGDDLIRSSWQNDEAPIKGGRQLLEEQPEASGDPVYRKYMRLNS